MTTFLFYSFRLYFFFISLAGFWRPPPLWAVPGGSCPPRYATACRNNFRQVNVVENAQGQSWKGGGVPSGRMYLSLTCDRAVISNSLLIS